ncbi:4-hydroxybutyrate CoA-transferase [Roseococcus sp. SDR]|uniref:acetyl-CoA hydrolase/transferase family protein n=1 Tax=Roseococcus sp. SDR TaxID=2835532 RepID=UPI001BCD36BA|nr:acetyl-CoA hydrolase/transferase C-terminal domain-containing protein [Roseococcus sp. SDR]MBS7788887.1 acetyl-CoA hydrolase/transferase family protein [Roseococcus sp. SDR]MBV1844201.1 4-hydroxybutyrate CoA-transferase [Roseococcus sp. SDR]
MSLDLARHIRPGDHILWGQVTGEPPSLVEALVEQRAALGGVGVFLGTGLARVLRPEHADHIAMRGLGGLGTFRALASAGVLEVLPVHGGQVHRMIAAGEIRCDVALLLLPPADEAGTHSLGPCVDYMDAGVARARTVIAEISPHVPDTGGHARIPAARLDAVWHSDRSPYLLPRAQPSAVERAIGAHVAALIPDGATIQTGLGALPEAVLAALTHHRDLGLHSGILGDGAMALMRAGVITNARKPLDPGISVTTTLVGSAELHRFAHRNAAIALKPSSHTHNEVVLAQLPCLFAINAAAEVDLTGQVNAERIGANVIGGVGGQADFARAAARSLGGASIIALPATASDGSSRIVARLSGPVTTPRSDVDVVVTELGLADLRGASERERARRIIAVAAPAAREDLERALKENPP